MARKKDDADPLSESEEDVFSEKNEDSDDSVDEAVYDLGDGESEAEENGSEQDESDDESDDNDESTFEEAIQAGGNYAPWAKGAKRIDQNFKLKQKEEGASDDEKEDDKGWGVDKRGYHETHIVNPDSDDDDLLKDEGAEALKLQKERLAALSAKDYEIHDSLLGEVDEEDEPTMGSLATHTSKKLSTGGKTAPGSKAAGGKAAVLESLSRDLKTLSRDDRVAALLARAPELLSMLQELQEALSETRHRFGPILGELREGGLCTAAGQAYLEARHLLLSSYAQHLAFYLLLRAEDRSVVDHPILERVVELKAYLDRLRPIDVMHQQQLQRLLKASELAALQQKEQQAIAKENALKKKEKEEEVLNEDKEAEKEKEKKERKEKEDKEKKEKEEKEKREKEEKDKKMKKKRRAEETDSDEEETMLFGNRELALLKARRLAEAREEVEDMDLEADGPSTKDTLRHLQSRKAKGVANASLMTDAFGDDVTDGNDLLRRTNLSQRYGGEHHTLGKKPRGGDDDLPRKAALFERRAQYDATAARRVAAAAAEEEEGGFEGMNERIKNSKSKNKALALSRNDDVDEEANFAEALDEQFGFSFGGKKKRGGRGVGGGEEEGGGGEDGDGEDEFYKKAKAKANQYKAKREALHRAPAPLPPVQDPNADEGVRAINVTIQRNRGLTPHRRRDLKNPRKKNRVKFQKAQVRHRGAVQPMREREGEKYGGEATGIKARVAKSRKLG